MRRWWRAHATLEWNLCFLFPCGSRQRQEATGRSKSDIERWQQVIIAGSSLASLVISISTTRSSGPGQDGCDGQLKMARASTHKSSILDCGLLNVRFAPDSDQIADIAEGPSCANRRHRARAIRSLHPRGRVRWGKLLVRLPSL